MGYKLSKMYIPVQEEDSHGINIDYSPSYGMQFNSSTHWAGVLKAANRRGRDPTRNDKQVREAGGATNGKYQDSAC